MRHIVLAAITTALLFTSVCSFAFAQDATSPSTTRRNRVQERVASRAADRMEDIQEKLAEHKDRIASRAAALRERLKEFKDKRKAALVERINDVLNKINERRTDAMKKHLKKMTELLDKLKERVAKKGAQGKDTSAANAAIASASAKIASASAAVDAQALKDYTITVSSESAVRSDAKAARDRLHTDLQIVRKLVVEAKQSVAAAIRIAATTLGGIGEGSKEATEGGSQ